MGLRAASRRITHRRDLKPRFALPRGKIKRPPQVLVTFRCPPEVLKLWQTYDPAFRSRLRRWMIRHCPKPIGVQIDDGRKDPEASSALDALDEL